MIDDTGNKRHLFSANQYMAIDNSSCGSIIWDTDNSQKDGLLGELLVHLMAF